MVKKISKGILLLSLVSILCLDACVFVPFIDSYKSMGVTEADRQGLLPKTLKSFQDNIYWGSYSRAVASVKEESIDDVRETFKRYKERKIVSIKTEDIAFSDLSKTATVQVLVKYYEIPQYVVNDENVEETWNFNLGEWTLSKRVILSDQEK